MGNRLLILLVLFVSLLSLQWYRTISKDEPCANTITCIKDLSGKLDTQDKLAQFHGNKIDVPFEKISLARTAPQERQILGETSYKRIEVDLSKQRVYAFENGKQVFEFPVSSGKWYPTPTGHFRIWIKLRYTKMSGGSQALGTYYYLPNVPYVMFFYNDQIAKARGFSLHGTYWHDNFGHPMSHGCVNMRTEDVAQLYAWAQPAGGEKGTIYASADNPGTEVFIYGETPKE